MSARPGAPARFVGIDMLKGCAILWVMLIHAEALRGHAVFTHLVNHAVGIFVVLFGLNSELWWRGRELRSDLGRWYASRARRLLVPMWAALAVWWALVLSFRPEGVHLSARLAVAQAGGYATHVRTGWFITAILQLVLLFPLLLALGRRFGRGPVFAAGLACTLGAVAVTPWIFWHWGQFNANVFSPRLLAHVTFGMLLAPHVGRLGWRAGGTAALAVAGAILVEERLAPDLLPYTQRLIEPPLVVVLLLVMERLRRVPGMAAALGWLGVNSYGLYLGQLLIHNAFLFALGLGGLHERLNPWAYAGALLVGALVFCRLGAASPRALQALRRVGTPVPDLAR